MTATTTHHHPPMSATATLTNCYVPLSSTDTSISSNFDPSKRPTDDNIDGNTLSHSKEDNSSSTNKQQQSRGPRTLRHIHLDKAILSQSTGSSLVEWGHTKLLVSVRGPRPINCSSMNAANNGGGLVCEGKCIKNGYIRLLIRFLTLLLCVICF